MNDSSYDFLVVGAGIVGLATAMELVQRFPDKKIVVVEKEDGLGKHQTTHNSGVIHSGIYYKPGSLKAQTCVKGVELMKAFCREHHIPLEETGKLILATHPKELPRLESLFQRSKANDIPGVQILEPPQIKEKEPHVAGLRALWVPSTSIVDYEKVCEQFAAIIRGRNGEIRLCEEVIGIKVADEIITVKTKKDVLQTKYLINCAGLFSDRIALMAGIDPGVRIVPFRGEYYKFKDDKCHYVKGLIYPVPDPALPFLGVHFTRMIKGGVEIGPNAVLAFKREGYTKTSFSLCDTFQSLTYLGFWRMAVNLKFMKIGVSEMYRSFFKKAFLNCARRMIPAIQDNDVIPYKSGVRAQALGPNGALVDDFWVKETHRMVHVLNAPSPAATASICIGQQIVDMCQAKFGLK